MYFGEEKNVKTKKASSFMIMCLLFVFLIPPHKKNN